jgi:CO/xanthine dehydrogenase Mo-binding subunit
VDGVEKVTGTARYTADLPAGGALVGKLLRSPYAHAELLEVDISASPGPARGACGHHRRRVRHAPTA